MTEKEWDEKWQTWWLMNYQHYLMELGASCKNETIMEMCRTLYSEAWAAAKATPTTHNNSLLPEGGETTEGGVSSAGDSVHRERSAPETLEDKCRFRCAVVTKGATNTIILKQRMRKL